VRRASFVAQLGSLVGGEAASRRRGRHATGSTGTTRQGRGSRTNLTPGGRSLPFSAPAGRLRSARSSIAQLVEQVTVNHRVAGSSPARGAITARRSERTRLVANSRGGGVEPFSGSGSQLIAALRCGRRCRALEPAVRRCRRRVVAEGDRPRRDLGWRRPHVRRGRSRADRRGGIAVTSPKKENDQPDQLTGSGRDAKTGRSCQATQAWG
jgi:hypothetical protein